MSEREDFCFIQIKKKIFNGRELERVKPNESVYQIKSNVLIYYSTPTKGPYSFPLVGNFYEKADTVIFVCVNDIIAFKIPTEKLQVINLPKYKDRNTLNVVISTTDNQEWYLLCKQEDSSAANAVEITNYKVNLKDL